MTPSYPASSTPSSAPDTTPGAVVPAATDVDAGTQVVAVYLASLESDASRKTMRRVLDRLAATMTERPGTRADAIPWHRLRSEHTTAIRAELLATYAPATVRKSLSALAGVLHQAWRLGLMTGDDYERARAWGKVRGAGLSGAEAGRHVDGGEVTALFVSCANDPRETTGARDAAIIAVLFGAGLRRAEAAGLDVDDYDRETGELIVRGKGGKLRRVECSNGSCDALAAWLEVRGDAPGPLFVAINKAGRLSPTMRRLTTTAIYLLVQRRAEAANVRHFSPHDARRTYAGELLDSGADIAVVQQLMGHASAATTAAYDRRGKEARRRAVRMLHVPYVPRQQADSPAPIGTPAGSP